MLPDTIFPLGDADEFIRSTAEQSRCSVKTGILASGPNSLYPVSAILIEISV
jgi:hypothetical protein